LGTPQSQTAALQTIINKDLNVRQTEDLVRKLSGQRTHQPQKRTAPPEIKALEEQLRNHLGTKISLNHRRKGGTLVIYYYSEEELESLIERLLGNGP
jgi:ParB family chromosome partitioning protein